MSMISEQVKELRKYSELCLQYGNERRAKELLKEAADTIESLSAKLAATNMERAENHYGDDIFAKIIASLKDETYRYGYGKSLETFQQSKMIVEHNVAEYKEKQLSEDYVGGWIACEDRLPEKEGAYITTRIVHDIWTNEYLREEVKIVAFLNRKWIQKPQYMVIAWKPLPEPYNNCPEFTKK